MKIDLGQLRDLKSRGLISTEQHRELPLLIHNYTTRCQWEDAWDDLTLQCRGLITDTVGNVISRPFRKFFNLAQHEAAAFRLPPINRNQGFSVSEKMDGSLGVLYPVRSGYRIAWSS